MLALRMKTLSRLAVNLPRIGNSIARQSRYGSTVKFYFLEESSGNKVEVQGTIGKTLLDIALENDIDIEGACGGELACSTCHVVVEQDLYDKLPAKKVEEDDMLDLAWGITDTLCCQLKVTPDIENCVFTVPAETNNMFKGNNVLN